MFLLLFPTLVWGWVGCPFGDLRRSGVSASPLVILSLCVLKSTQFVSLLVFTCVTFGVCVASSPLGHATTSLEDWFFPVLTACSLLFGAREADLTRLQRLQSKTVRLIMSCGRDQSYIDLLGELHWLPVERRIICILMLYIL